MTFKQAIDLGGSVIKGSKCARSVFYGTFEKDDSQTEHVTDGAESKSRTPFAKCNNVFNADQIEGLPDAFYILPETYTLVSEKRPKRAIFCEETEEVMGAPPYLYT